MDKLKYNQNLAATWSEDSSDGYEANALYDFSKRANCSPSTAREEAAEYERAYWHQPFCNERMLYVADTLRNLADKLYDLS